jgi:hypothetical protein
LHDTCDCCSDICGGCAGSGNGVYYTGPANGAPVKAEEIKKLPLPQDPPPVGKE